MCVAWHQTDENYWLNFWNYLIWFIYFRLIFFPYWCTHDATLIQPTQFSALIWSHKLSFLMSKTDHNLRIEDCFIDARLSTLVVFNSQFGRIGMILKIFFPTHDTTTYMKAVTTYSVALCFCPHSIHLRLSLLSCHVQSQFYLKCIDEIFLLSFRLFMFILFLSPEWHFADFATFCIVRDFRSMIWRQFIAIDILFAAALKTIFGNVKENWIFFVGVSRHFSSSQQKHFYFIFLC